VFSIDKLSVVGISVVEFVGVGAFCISVVVSWGDSRVEFASDVLCSEGLVSSVSLTFLLLSF